MKKLLNCAALLMLLSILNIPVSSVLAQGTAFTYQGRLNDGSGPAHGDYDFRFKLFEDPLGNTQTGSTVLTNGITITNGLFVTTIDFGEGVFTGSNYWLAIDVRTNGGSTYTALDPLQPLNPVPYAIFANTASNLSGTLPAGQLSGVVPSTNLSGTYGSAVVFNNASGNFSGNGAGLAGVNAAALGGLAASNFWQTGGNGGTTAGANYVGTTDNQPLELHVNAVRGWRLEPTPHAGSVNVVGGSSANNIGPGVYGSTIGGGGSLDYYGTPTNTILANVSTIGGGDGNTIQTNASETTIAGGNQNSILASSFRSTIAGGFANVIGTNVEAGFIGGGEGNNIPANSGWSVIGGGYGNYAGYLGVIGGGDQNSLNTASFGFIGNGYINVVGTNSYYSAIMNGYGNVIGATVYESAIVDGFSNSLATSYSFMGSGYENMLQAYSKFSVLNGGETNLILTGSDHSVIGGGGGNTIGAPYATIPGGFANTASGRYSFAAGSYAQAATDGSFVWSDSSSTNVVVAYLTNQFVVRAQGGVYILNGPEGVNVDQFNSNTGTISGALRFGIGSGEGIGSQRNPGANQYGLDFYTGFTPKMSISQGGTVSVPGLINLGSQTGTTEVPSQSGLVIRRINSTSTSPGSIIARSDLLTLERDGSYGGIRISYPATPGPQTIAAMGIDSSGGQVNFYTTLQNPATAGTVQIYTGAQNVHFFKISFGNTFNNGHVTEVTLARALDDYYWVGTVTSTYNQ